MVTWGLGVLGITLLAEKLLIHITVWFIISTIMHPGIFDNGIMIIIAREHSLITLIYLLIYAVCSHNDVVCSGPLL